MLVVSSEHGRRLFDLHRELVEEQKPQTIEHAIEIHKMINRAEYRPPKYATEAMLSEMIVDKMVGKGMSFNPTSFITTDRRMVTRAEATATGQRITRALSEKYGLANAGRASILKAIPMETPRDVIFTLRALFAIHCIRTGGNYEAPKPALAN